MIRSLTDNHIAEAEHVVVQHRPSESGDHECVNHARSAEPGHIKESGQIPIPKATRSFEDDRFRKVPFVSCYAVYSRQLWTADKRHVQKHLIFVDV